MPYAYSEDTLIEQTAISIFKDLKWETANVLQGERFGAGGTLGRASEADVFLLAVSPKPKNQSRLLYSFAATDGSNDRRVAPAGRPYL